MTSPDIAEQIRTQDNLATADPIFLVQQQRRIYGMDPDFADEGQIAYLLDGESLSGEDLEAAKKAWDENGTIDDDVTRTGYIDVWEFATCCFTRQAAEDYIACNGHNLKEPRIYVDSAWRNQEWQAVRAFLAASGSALECAMTALENRIHQVTEHIASDDRLGGLKPILEEGLGKDKAALAILRAVTPQTNVVEPTAPATPAPYRYFVSYTWSNATSRTAGNGRCDISRHTPISSAGDVHGIEKSIADQTTQLEPGSVVLVNNWKRFEEASV